MEEVKAPKRFLVIDDEPMMRMLIASKLRREFGVQSHVDLVIDGAQALALIKANKTKNIFYDLITCDYNLGPDGSGQFKDSGAKCVFNIRNLGEHCETVPIRCITSEVEAMQTELAQLFGKPIAELPCLIFEDKDPKANVERRKFSLQPTVDEMRLARDQRAGTYPLMRVSPSNK